MSIRVRFRNNWSSKTGLTLVAARHHQKQILEHAHDDRYRPEVCRQVRRTSDVPILMLTARGDEADRVSGLTLGADDYVVKPFSPRELVARVKAILRRGRRKRDDDTAVLRHGTLVMDTERHEFTVNGEPVSLTSHEFKLLHALLSSPGKVFLRDELLRRLYDSDEVNVVDRVIDVHIGKLRQKIEKNPSQPSHILTVRGMGYKLAEEADVKV
ncbi:MAG: response regulator transcription factor [Deltaproteobacteria bacterium]